MTTMNVSINLELDNQFFEDILVTALEGGSNYWIGKIRCRSGTEIRPKDLSLSMWVSKTICDGGIVEISSSGETPEIYQLTKSKLLEGVDLWIKTNPRSLDIIKTNDGKFTIDSCNIDAGDSDNILQHALFGEVVYG